MLDKSKFINLISGLCELYNQQISEFLLDLYYDMFKDYDYQQIENAVKKVIASHKYNTLPKPADILEFLEGTKDDKALNAWLQVREAVRKVGYYFTPDFQDPIISHCLQELGGWMEFCSIQIDELPFIEKRFKDYYNIFLKREENKPIRLIGFIELKNIEKGYNKDLPKPILIGFDKKLLKDK